MSLPESPAISGMTTQSPANFRNHILIKAMTIYEDSSHKEKFKHKDLFKYLL